jgi:hypothetical protein
MPTQNIVIVTDDPSYFAPLCDYWMACGYQPTCLEVNQETLPQCRALDPSAILYDYPASARHKENDWYRVISSTLRGDIASEEHIPLVYIFPDELRPKVLAFHLEPDTWVWRSIVQIDFMQVHEALVAARHAKEHLHTDKT